jgi:hypothetical protein
VLPGAFHRGLDAGAGAPSHNRSMKFNATAGKGVREKLEAQMREIEEKKKEAEEAVKQAEKRENEKVKKGDENVAVPITA